MAPSLYIERPDYMYFIVVSIFCVSKNFRQFSNLVYFARKAQVLNINFQINASKSFTSFYKRVYVCGGGGEEQKINSVSDMFVTKLLRFLHSYFLECLPSASLPSPPEFISLILMLEVFGVREKHFSVLLKIWNSEGI